MEELGDLEAQADPGVKVEVDQHFVAAANRGLPATLASREYLDTTEIRARSVTTISTTIK